MKVHRRQRRSFVSWGTGSIRELPAHRNAGLEIVYISSGHLRWRIENRVYNPKPGSVFFTFPWELHGSVDEFEPGHRWDFVVLRIRRNASVRKWTLPADFGFSASASRQLLCRLVRSPHRCLPAGKRLQWLLPSLQQELAAPQGGNQSMALTLTKAVLLELDRIVAQAPLKTSQRGSPRPKGCKKLFKRLHEDYASSWSLEAMSSILGLGRTRLSQVVREWTGDSPIEYLNRLRIGKSQELLRLPDRSITDIAFACGFQTSQYFARTFKQLTGRTPRAYRANWRKTQPMKS